MRVAEFEQRSPEWYQTRVGRVTASRIGTLASVKKDGSPTKESQDLLLELLAEQLTGAQAEHFTSKEMQWGIDNEGLARAQYELATGAEVLEVGFVHHPSIQWAGCSPDGLVGEDGLVEIKCPSTITFLRHRLAVYKQLQDMPYYSQVQFQLACTGRKWCDLAYFDPRLPDNINLHITLINRDDTYIEFLEDCTRRTLEKIEALKKQIGVVHVA